MLLRRGRIIWRRRDAARAVAATRDRDPVLHVVFVRMSDYTAKRIVRWRPPRGGFVKARAELGVTAFGMQVIQLPPDYSDYPSTTRGERPGGGLPADRRLRLDEIDGERVNLDQETFVRVGPEPRRKLYAGSEGLRILVIGGCPASLQARAQHRTGVSRLSANSDAARYVHLRDALLSILELALLFLWIWMRWRGVRHLRQPGPVQLGQGAVDAVHHRLPADRGAGLPDHPRPHDARTPGAQPRAVRRVPPFLRRGASSGAIAG